MPIKLVQEPQAQSQVQPQAQQPQQQAVEPPPSNMRGNNVARPASTPAQQTTDNSDAQIKAATTQQQNAPSTPLGPGTGFVNIDRYLAANQGIGSDVAKAGAKSLGEVQGHFDKASGLANMALTDAMPRALTDEQVQSIANGSIAKSGMHGSSGSTIFGEGVPGAMAAATNALSGKFSGPTSIDYNAATDTSMQGAKALANNASTGRELAARAGITGEYTPQLSSIDAALYGQVAGAMQARQALGSNIKQEVARQGQAQSDFSKAVGNANVQAANVRLDAINKLQSAAQGILGPAQQAAAAANAQDLANFNAGNDPKGRAEAAAKAAGGTLMDQAIAYTNAPTREWVPGGTANAGNFINGAQASGLTNIAQLLNDPSLAVSAQQPYQAGHWLQDEARPVGDLNVSSDPFSANFQTPAAAAAQEQARKQEAERMKAAAHPQDERDNEARDISSIVGGALFGLPALFSQLGRK